jgi:predicted phage tail protein
MKTLFLHGSLKEKYGESFRLAVESPSEAIRAIAVQIPGFEEEIKSGRWHILRGALEDQESLDENGINLALGKTNEIHILPVVEGANNALMIVVGIVIFIAGFFTGGTAWSAYGPMMMGIGAGMAIGGIIGMMTKLPNGTDPSAGEGADDRASFLFNGPTNTSSQGVGVPRGYGRVRVGSIVVSAALYSENLSV